MNVIIETTLLKPVATATTVARTEPIDLDQFYQHVKEFEHLEFFLGVRVRETFRQRFDLGVAQAAPSRSYVASVVKEDALVEDTRKELPEDHLSTLADIASFIKEQAEGQDGFLLTDGCADVFFVLGKNDQVFLLDVYYACVYGDYKEWFIDDWPIDEDGKAKTNNECDAGLRILCPGTATL